jgi:hypothetical protein
MRMMVRGLVALAMVLGSGSLGHADIVPPIKGNDTGGIISYNLVGTVDVNAVAYAHCAQYGKVPKFRGAQRYYGGYLSFACTWVPIGSYDRPLRVRS